jgi:hypothetical protein
MSFGIKPSSEIKSAIDSAIVYAIQKNVMLIAASGNIYRVMQGNFTPAFPQNRT